MNPLENKNSKDFLTPSNEFRTMMLDRFCVKKNFEIGLVNTLTTEDEPFLNSLVSLNKTKEKLTHVTFIEAATVENFIKAASTTTEEFLFPPQLIEDLKKFSKSQGERCSSGLQMKEEYEAYSIKFKLIQAMYEQFFDEVKNKKRRDLLSRDLTGLTEKRSIKSRDKRSNMGSRSKQSTIKNKKKSREKPQEIVDCTDVGIMENDLIVDDVLKEQVYFYILKGYYNINLIKYLSKMQVKVAFIIQISEYEINEHRVFNNFWKEIDTVRSFPSDYLQDIALMKYQAPPHDETSISLESCLKDVVDIVKNIIDLKRMHFDYVKELKLFDAKFTEIVTVFPVYHKLMNIYPLETINIPIIIDGILQQVQMKSRNPSDAPTKQTKPMSKERLSCPFDFSPRVRRSETQVENNQPYFKVYEKDNLNLNFNAYKLGYEYMKNALSVLKIQLPILLAEQCKFTSILDDCLPHAHHVCIPSNSQPIFTNEQVDYLINLLYLKNSVLIRKTGNNTYSNEFINNLIVHDEHKHVENSRPTYVYEKSWNMSEPLHDMENITNVYEAINPLSLHWAEMLKQDVLYQSLLDSQLRYICADYINCELTNSLMVRFHNDVDPFGLHTKVCNEYLRTPVGLADFCKFVLTDDYEWLKQHKPYAQVTYVDVVRMLEKETAVRLYEDAANEKYKRLLLPQIQYSSADTRKYTHCPCIEENVCKMIDTNSSTKLIHHSVLSANLLSILHDLEEYKKCVDFSEHCNREIGKSYSFAAYNLGSTKFNVIGHITSFISLDNVTLTVDSSRLRVQKFNLTVKLLSDDNLLVLHTKQNNFNFHIILSDGTIIFFSKPSIDKKSIEELTSSLLIRYGGSNPDVDQTSFGCSLLSHESFDSKQEEDEKTLISMNYDHYSSLELYPVVGNMIREPPEKLNRTDLEKEIDILKRLRNETNCIKVSKRASLKHLEQIVTENPVPISNIVRRIINNPAKPQLCEAPKRKCVIRGEVQRKKYNSSFDYVVTVPNGLTITLLPSELLPGSSVIKQAYEHDQSPENISEEKYRMFTGDGTIVIGKIDGTMKILTSNGIEVRFDKIQNSISEDMNCKFRKKLDENLIRKLLTRLMDIHPDQENSDFYPSRRGHLHSKSKLVSNCPNLFEVSKIPFSVISMITLEGYKITLKKEKLFKALHSRHMSEMDFLTGQRHFKREDGFRSTTNRDGSHYVEFPDGTSIRTIAHIEETLIKMNENDEMGWILVTSSFSFEHPFYKPIHFDNVKNIIKIRLNERQSLDISDDGARLDDMKNSMWDVRTDVISLTKKCTRCNGLYKCEVMVDPLYQKNDPGEDACFVTAEDSYNKIFKADYLGNCKVMPSFVRGAMNKNDCNHVLLSDHQKIYSINKDLSGMLLWNDKKVTTDIKDKGEGKIIHHINETKRTLVFLSITRDVSTKFNERFLGKMIREFENFKEMIPAHRPVTYQLIRNLYSMIEMVQIEDLLKCLRDFFKEEMEQDVAETSSALEFLKKYATRSQSTFTHSSEEVTKQAQSTISIHARIMELNRKDAEVKRIMRCPIPNYFDSQLCTFVPPKTSKLTDSIRKPNQKS